VFLLIEKEKVFTDKKILIIVPAYNEEEAIGHTLDKLYVIQEELPNMDVCVINDGSNDKTVEIAKSHHVTVIDLPINLGIGGGMQTGYKYAYYHGYDIAVQFDADGQHNELDIKALLSPIINDEADMVVGSRYVKKTEYKGSLSRRIGIFYFTGLLFLLTRKKFTDPTSGFRAKNKKVIRQFAELYPRDYPEPEVLISLHKKGFEIKEVSVNMKERQGGTSSITPLKSVYYMLKVTLSILMQRLIKES
jgi:glycosyltransferase involved in cell wall biosynthesis